MILHVVTRCSREENLEEIYKDLKLKINSGFHIQWHLLIDALKVTSELDYEYLADSFIRVKWLEKQGDDQYLHRQISEYCRDEIEDGWIVFVDDDNILHENYFRIVGSHVEEESTSFIVTHQDINYKDFTRSKIREAIPENVKVGSIDLAQVTFRHSVFKDYSLNTEYTGDGIFLESMYNTSPELFKFVDGIAAYYNYFSGPSVTFLPVILYIGNDTSLFTTTGFDYVEKYLNVVYREDDSDLHLLESVMKIDLIVTEPEIRSKLTQLPFRTIHTRRKWIELERDQPYRGDLMYSSFMQNTLEKHDSQELISIFTSTYNTGRDIFKLYHSLTQQTYSNWEWVVVDDSTDSGITYNALLGIAKVDNRVKVYSLDKKSGGVIGEAKYRAAAFTTGDILLEVDHDDLLLSNACTLVLEAARTYPDAGFFYSDCVEVNSDFSVRSYGEGWGFGYGTYRTEVVDLFGKRSLTVPVTPSINPKTIRHIVSSPNHLRAWRRNVYFEIGGYNRNLSIVDDYELMVRTFLRTLMVYIPYVCYVQIFNGGNSQDKCRPEISRRVDLVRRIYNSRINKRFEELGVEDWCDDEYKFYYEPIKVGEDEGKVNLVYTSDSQNASLFIEN